MENCIFIGKRNLEMCFIIWNKTQQITYVGKYDSVFAYVVNTGEIRDDIMANISSIFLSYQVIHIS